MIYSLRRVWWTPPLRTVAAGIVSVPSRISRRIQWRTDFPYLSIVTSDQMHQKFLFVFGWPHELVVHIGDFEHYRQKRGFGVCHTLIRFTEISIDAPFRAVASSLLLSDGWRDNIPRGRSSNHMASLWPNGRRRHNISQSRISHSTPWVLYSPLLLITIKCLFFSPQSNVASVYIFLSLPFTNVSPQSPPRLHLHHPWTISLRQ